MIKNTLASFFKLSVLEAGVDEAGRGCLAGPVFAAAVILPEGFSHALLRDSKQMTPKNREELRKVIEAEALDWSVGMSSAEEIDRINILRATYLAMHRAIGGLNMKPEFLIIDGNRFSPYENIPHQTIVGGDDKYMSIAAASVLAKTHRDANMMELHRQFPEYGFDRHKGYGTVMHRDAISKYGMIEAHRKSFRLKDVQLKLLKQHFTD